jgi:hypothetical protein
MAGLRPFKRKGIIALYSPIDEYPMDFKSKTILIKGGVAL